MMAETKPYTQTAAFTTVRENFFHFTLEHNY